MWIKETSNRVILYLVLVGTIAMGVAVNFYAFVFSISPDHPSPSTEQVIFREYKGHTYYVRGWESEGLDHTLHAFVALWGITLILGFIYWACYRERPDFPGWFVRVFVVLLLLAAISPFGVHYWLTSM